MAPEPTFSLAVTALVACINEIYTWAKQAFPYFFPKTDIVYVSEPVRFFLLPRVIFSFLLPCHTTSSSSQLAWLLDPAPLWELEGPLRVREIFFFLLCHTTCRACANSLLQWYQPISLLLLEDWEFLFRACEICLCVRMWPFIFQKEERDRLPCNSCRNVCFYLFIHYVRAFHL